MQVQVALTNDGLLPDRFGKYADEEDMLEGHPVRSFPIGLMDVPEEAKSLALTLLDWDAIPVGGFCWIHWIACNIPPSTRFIPENASQAGGVPCVQGCNSDFSPFAGGLTSPNVIHRYVGPQPPDKMHAYTLTVYALDRVLDLREGYYLNEFRRAMRDHVLEEARIEIPSRA